MLLNTIPQRRRRAIYLLGALFAGVSLFQLLRLSPEGSFQHAILKWKPSSLGTTYAGLNNTIPDTSRGSIDLVPEYHSDPSETSSCAGYLSHQYLEKFRDTATAHCTPESSTALTCFHGRTTSESPIDSFCIGQSGSFDITNSDERKIRLGCDLRPLSDDERAAGIAEVKAFRAYWYETGPANIIKQFMSFDKDLVITPGSNFTVLVKREGAFNTWHSLMEIWSLFMTFDILRMTTNPATNMPFFTPDDAERTRILILDDHDDGPYYDLWTVFAKRPMLRIKDLSEADALNSEKIIIPLPGSTNPMWSGDWDVVSCDHSDTLKAFSKRVLDFYDVDNTKPHEGEIVFTWSVRKGHRRLIDEDAHIAELEKKFPHVKIRKVDFAALTFKEQVQVASETDVLAGVHGAGLTHGMFLPKSSAMVEIIPQELNHKGFRNLANIAGHMYFSVHGLIATPGPTAKRDWQLDDVVLERERFMSVMELAIKSMYNRGLRNLDVNKV